MKLFEVFPFSDFRYGETVFASQSVEGSKILNNDDTIADDYDGDYDNNDFTIKIDMVMSISNSILQVIKLFLLSCIDKNWRCRCRKCVT